MHNRAHHRQISVLRVCWLPTGAQAHIPHTSPRIVFFLLKLSVAANNFRVPRFLLRLRLPHSQFCLIAPGLPPGEAELRILPHSQFCLTSRPTTTSPTPCDPFPSPSVGVGSAPGASRGEVPGKSRRFSIFWGGDRGNDTCDWDMP